MSYIKKLTDKSLSAGIGILLVTGLSGCGGQSSNQDTSNNSNSNVQTEKKNAFVVIEETAPGKYKVAEEFPAKETRIILKKLDGTEKVLTKEEMDQLIKKEEAKIDNGTSNLTKPDGAQIAQQNGGMGLGEAILASAAGAMVGSWLGNKLFNNQNYQHNRQAGYKSPSTYNRSVNSFRRSSPLKRNSSSFGSSSTRRSGFFGSSRRYSSHRSSYRSFGG